MKCQHGIPRVAVGRYTVSRNDKIHPLNDVSFFLFQTFGVRIREGKWCEWMEICNLRVDYPGIARAPNAGSVAPIM